MLKWWTSSETKGQITGSGRKSKLRAKAARTKFFQKRTRAFLPSSSSPRPSRCLVSDWVCGQSEPSIYGGTFVIFLNWRNFLIRNIIFLFELGADWPHKYLWGQSETRLRLDHGWNCSAKGSLPWVLLFVLVNMNLRSQCSWMSTSVKCPLVSYFTHFYFSQFGWSERRRIWNVWTLTI